MPTSSLSPIEISQQLRGIDFPADKQDLVQQARDNNADDAVIRELQPMPDKEFNSMSDVTSALKQSGALGGGDRSQGRGTSQFGED